MTFHAQVSELVLSVVCADDGSCWDALDELTGEVEALHAELLGLPTAAEAAASSAAEAAASAAAPAAADAASGVAADVPAGLPSLVVVEVAAAELHPWEARAFVLSLGGPSAVLSAAQSADIADETDETDETDEEGAAAAHRWHPPAGPPMPPGNGTGTGSLRLARVWCEGDYAARHYGVRCGFPSMGDRGVKHHVDTVCAALYSPVACLLALAAAAPDGGGPLEALPEAVRARWLGSPPGTSTRAGAAASHRDSRLASSGRMTREQEIGVR